MNTVYLNRKAWGADPNLPRLGYIVAPSKRTEVFIHHTVAVDDDATPNIWESLDEVRYWMGRLQTIRPDLGLDVPYNFVAFFCLIDGVATLVICEGRGVDRTGAHTIGHNTPAIAIAVHGNFQLPTFGLLAYLPPIGEWLAVLKEENSLINLGNVHPPARDVFGHRDVYGTACPGDHLYINLGAIKIELPVEEEDDMAKLVRKAGDNRVFVFDGASFRHVPGGSFAKAVYGDGYNADVIDVANKDDPLHPFGNAKLPVYFPDGRAAE